MKREKTYLALGAITSIEEGAEAVVAVALGLAWRLGVWCSAVETLVGVLEDRLVAWAYEATLFGAVTVDGFITSTTPVGLSIGDSAGSWWRILGSDSNDGSSREEDVLERNHDGCWLREYYLRLWG